MKELSLTNFVTIQASQLSQDGCSAIFMGFLFLLWKGKDLKTYTGTNITGCSGALMRTAGKASLSLGKDAIRSVNSFIGCCGQKNKTQTSSVGFGSCLGARGCGSMSAGGDAVTCSFCTLDLNSAHSARPPATSL